MNWTLFVVRLIQGYGALVLFLLPYTLMSSYICVLMLFLEFSLRKHQWICVPCFTEKSFFFKLFLGHTFAMGTETFIPRSQWDVKQLVWDNKGM